MDKRKVLFLASRCSVPEGLAFDLSDEQNPHIEAITDSGLPSIEKFAEDIAAVVIEPRPGIEEVNFGELIKDIRTKYPQTKILVYMMDENYQGKYFSGYHEGVKVLRPNCDFDDIRSALYKALDIRGQSQAGARDSRGGGRFN